VKSVKLLLRTLSPTKNIIRDDAQLKALLEKPMPRQLVKPLNNRHHEIIRLAFLGKTNVQIAGVVGITPPAVGCVLRSPMAQAELARLRHGAEENLVNVPLRARLMEDLVGAGTEAVRLNRGLMNEPTIDVKTRARIATHFMDRIVFDQRPEDAREGSYRDILRSLSDINQKMDSGVMLLPPINGSSDTD